MSGCGAVEVTRMKYTWGRKYGMEGLGNGENGIMMNWVRHILWEAYLYR